MERWNGGTAERRNDGTAECWNKERLKIPRNPKRAMMENRSKSRLERETLILSLCQGIFTDRSILGFFSREIILLRSVWVRIGKVKQWRPHVHTST